MWLFHYHSSSTKANAKELAYMQKTAFMSCKVALYQADLTSAVTVGKLSPKDSGKLDSW
jgi:hypothetical protein